MSKRDAQNIISSYRKKQKSGPVLGLILVVVIIVAGLVLVILALTNGNGNTPGLFAAKSTETPTETITPTATLAPPTATETLVPTITLTPTITETPMPSAPFEYEIQEGDTPIGLAERFTVDLDVLMAINNWSSNPIIHVGEIIYIPLPNQVMPTETPIPTDTAPGTLIEYRVRSGDNLYSIAARFYSTIERIIAETNKYRDRMKITNKLNDGSEIVPGDILVIPVYIATPVPTLTPRTPPVMPWQTTTTVTPTP